MPGPDPSSSPPSSFPSLGTVGSGLSGIGNIYSGLSRGGVGGDLSAALSANNTLNSLGGYGLNGTVDTGLGGSVGLGGLGSALGIYQGLKSGGVMGYGQALGSGAQLAGSALGDTALSTVGADIAAPLGVYNFLNNWQSGNTGSDALNGASAGAGIGTAIEPGLGTAVGAVIGGAVGAISSAFGPGRADPEMSSWQNYVQGFNQYGGQMNSQNVSPQQAFTSLAGIFDSRTANDNPLYNQFGRMGEGAMMQGMAAQINSAYSKGTINSQSTPQQIYQKVVQPWIGTMPGGSQWNSTYNQGQVGGNGVVQNLLETLIGQYTSGAFNSNTPVTVSGLSFAQNGATLPAFAGIGNAPVASGTSSKSSPSSFPALKRTARMQ